ncbi:NAD(P)H-binding protein [Myxococcota bacterium]|nr:NAD(P)H-binding protein [Myxococcota bacterium]
MSTAFVAGATGYTGREVVRLLAERHVSTWAHVRPESARLAEWRTRFEALGARVDATPWTLDAMTETMARVRPDVVFALLGTTRARAKAAAARGERSDYEAVDWGLTVMLLEAVERAGTTSKFIYLSSIGAGPSARGAYLEVRHRVEERLRTSRVPWVSARPSFITGEDRDEDRPGERIGSAIADRALDVARVLGARHLAARWRSTTNTALAGALVRVALDPSKVNVVVESEELR